MTVYLGAIKKNTMEIEIFIESESFLNLIKKTPTLKQLFHDNQLNNLKVGKNIIVVNKYIYSKLDNFGFFDVKKM